RNCRIQSQNDIPERISDEQKIDPGSIEQPGHRGIVGRQHDDSLAPLLHQDEVRHSDPSGRGVHHEVPAVQWLRATGISFLSLMTAAGSGLISFAAAWWFTISREPRWPVRNVQTHWTNTLIRRLAVARNWMWISAHPSQAKNPLK